MPYVLFRFLLKFDNKNDFNLFLLKFGVLGIAFHVTQRDIHAIGVSNGIGTYIIFQDWLRGRPTPPIALRVLLVLK